MFAQRDSLVPFIKNINGFKVGFLNYTYGTNGIEPRDGAEISLIDRDKMKKEISITRDSGAEIVVVTMHWGIEYVLLENASQRSLADFLVEQGVDMIIGGHPHVIQPMKVVHNEKENKDVLIVYSLGNFISNMKTADTRGGALVRATIVRDSDGKARFSHADYDTFFSAKPEGEKSNFMVVRHGCPKRSRHHRRPIGTYSTEALKKYSTATMSMFQEGINEYNTQNSVTKLQKRNLPTCLCKMN